MNTIQLTPEIEDLIALETGIHDWGARVETWGKF